MVFVNNVACKIIIDTRLLDFVLGNANIFTIYGRKGDKEGQRVVRLTTKEGSPKLKYDVST